MNNLSLRGFASLPHVDLAQGVRGVVPGTSRISLRAMLSAATPPAPSFKVNAVPDGDRVDASWSSPGATSFELQFSPDRQMWREVYGGPAPAISVKLTDVHPYLRGRGLKHGGAGWAGMTVGLPRTRGPLQMYVAA